MSAQIPAATTDITASNSLAARRRVVLNADDLRYVLRTLTRLNRIAKKVPAEDLAAALLPHPHRYDLLLFLATYLNDVEEFGLPLAKAQWRRCAECGHELDCRFYSIRSDAHFCSPKCRQKAYRKRVTARASPGTLEASQCDVSSRADNGLAVTQARAAAEDAAP
jgi:hypothetical protein